jgi:hypothetical protein
MMVQFAESRPGTLAMLCTAILLSACEGIFTGTAVQNLPLETDAGGGFKPVVVTLTSEMSPVSLNFHAELGINPHEAGKWNGYQATLSHAGRPVARREFNVNYTGTAESPPAHPSLVVSMLVYRIETSGEYELSITPVKAIDVALLNTRVEVRRNVQVPQ